MRKILSLIIIAVIISFGCGAVRTIAASSQNQMHPSKKEFEQRLKLTEKQKQKAKIIHSKGREQMKPIVYQIELKHQEIEAVKNTKLLERDKQEQINQLLEDIRNLDKQAQDIRKKNSQEFEKILNKKQRAELAKMKAEGRARFEKNHPPRPPFQGLGAPNFLMPRPLFPPQQPFFSNK